MNSTQRSVLAAQPVRKEGEKAVPPRDAATIIIWRKTRQRVEVLMGERHKSHRFLPHRYVFPGGTVDPQDSRIRVASEMSPAVACQLGRTTRKGRAKSIAIAAIRETFEETGLIIGAQDPAPHRPALPDWEKFFGLGYAPALEQLEYIARAITPVFRPMRFDARFFLMHSDEVIGNIEGSGELEKLAWIPVNDTQMFELANVTRKILAYAEVLIEDPVRQTARRKIPYFKHLPNGGHLIVMQ